MKVNQAGSPQRRYGLLQRSAMGIRSEAAFHDMRVPFAFAYHVDQWLITEGYDNRCRLRDTLGSVNSKSVVGRAPEPQRTDDIPATLHYSDTLLKIIARHPLAFLQGLSPRPKVQPSGRVTGQEWSQTRPYAQSRRGLPWGLGSFTARDPFCRRTKGGGSCPVRTGS